MVPAESLELLSKVSLRTWPDDQVPDAAHMLINQCGRLPLALRIVGAILKNKPYWMLEKVAADLAGEQTRLTKLAAGCCASGACPYLLVLCGAPLACLLCQPRPRNVRNLIW